MRLKVIIDDRSISGRRHVQQIFDVKLPESVVSDIDVSCSIRRGDYAN